MSAPFRILSVHAHPDDEASKGAPTVARYLASGVGATLVCCTGGECGEVLNPALDTPEVWADLAAVRRRELDESTRIIGYDTVELLGYRDSGMPDTEDNARPDNFWNAPLDESAARLARIIRRDRPQVVLTYGDDQQHYAHPDHLKVHDITGPAVELAADASWEPESGEPWQVLKIYYSVWSAARMLKMHDKFVELGVDSPFDDEWIAKVKEFGQDHRITTSIDIAEFYEVREHALKAHATQVDPTSPFWFGLPTEVQRDLHPFEDFILATSAVGMDVPEVDLFAGVPGWQGFGDG
jgi:mycothiol S-conjugate amidase